MKMVNWTILCLLNLVATSLSSAQSQQPLPAIPSYAKHPRSLEIAVKNFNERAMRSDIGKSQPRLTVNEVMKSLAVAGGFFSLLPDNANLESYIQQTISTMQLPAFSDIKMFEGTDNGAGCWTVYIEFELNKNVHPFGERRPRALIRHMVVTAAKTPGR